MTQLFDCPPAPSTLSHTLISLAVFYSSTPLTQLLDFTNKWPGFTSSQLSDAAATIDNIIASCQAGGLEGYQCVQLSANCPSFSTTQDATETNVG